MEAVTSFLVEAGSATTLANLAVLNTGSSAPSLSVDTVPFGVYFVRVRGVGADGIRGPPSNEIVWALVAPAAVRRGAPLNLTRQVIGNQVNLAWQAPSGGDPQRATTSKRAQPAR